MKNMMPFSAKPELLKQLNQEYIIRTIVRHGAISRAALARELGLALPSVMRLTDDLLDKGLLKSLGLGPATGGRKANLLCMNDGYGYIVGVEIASEIRLCLTDFGGSLIEVKHLPFLADTSPQQDLIRIADQVKSMFTQHHIEKSKVLALGVGTPGSGFKHQVAVPGFIKPGWEAIDVKAQLQRLTGLKVIVENVARTSALGEIWFGQGRQNPSFVYTYIDWGVGLAMVDQGHIVEGANGVAGELGHMRIEAKGRPCYCGGQGCLEMYVSVAAIQNQAQALNLEAINQDQVINDAAQALAMGLGNVINLLNPPIIVLGGSVPLKLQGIVDVLTKNLNQFVFHNKASQTPLLVSQVDKSLCLGSIALVIHHEVMNQILP